MQTHFRRHALTLTLLFGGIGLTAHPAQAQVLSGLPSNVGSIATGRAPEVANGGNGRGAPAAPAAIPGNTARAPAAPLTRPPSEMEPTEELFDAINRGDIASARDAINRGADLHAVNVLGMTPMDLAVDLGRNDISFLLLSMRGDDGGPSGPPSGPPTSRQATAAGNAKAAPAGRTVFAKEAQRRPVVTKVAPSPAPAAPKLWANDGGTPRPTEGFLGFGSRQASN